MVEICVRKKQIKSPYHDHRAMKVSLTISIGHEISAQCGWILCSGTYWFKNFRLPGRNMKLIPLHRGQERPIKEEGHSRFLNDNVISKEIIPRLVLNGQKVCISTVAHQKLKHLYKDLTEVSHIFRSDIFINTLLSQGSILENVSCCGKSRQNVCYNGQGGGKESWVAWLQLEGPLVVTFSG